jgi:tellurite resistance protein
MFVDVLAKEEKEGLISLLTCIAKIDGEISEQEIKFLTEYSKEHSVQIDLKSEIELEAACSLIKSDKSKVVAIQEIIKIAISDGDYDSSERQGVFAISKMLLMSPELFYRIESWVIQGQRWVQAGEEMVATA